MGVMLELIQKRIARYFEAATGEAPAPGENLFDHGALDSFGVVEFLAFLEKDLNAEIRLDEITLDNFSTIERISTLVMESGGHA
jgi:acyl carrier protein